MSGNGYDATVVKRGLMIVLGAALASAFACGKGFEGSDGGSGPTPQSCTSTSDLSLIHI